MLELKKTSATLQENYNYSDGNVMGTVTVNSDQVSGEKTSANGQVYEKKADGSQGAYIGNFNGQLVNGVWKYGTSQMSREQYETVMDLLDEIEKELLADGE